jgi:(p)ppGpp synthase/HD superfamily hydrolase
MNIEEIKNYAIKAHADTNHRYGDHPYSVHLIRVVDIAEEYYDTVFGTPIHKQTEEYKKDVIGACWCHDLIEDARQTFNDVIENTGSNEIASIVYAVTNEKGRSRHERANDKYYEGIRNKGLSAMFVKICDRIANYEFSKENGSNMAGRYRKEMLEFIREVFHDPRLYPMLKRLAS